MKDLQEYIAEAIVNEAAPKFSNDENGIKEFCDYVFDPRFVKYVINPDLTITLESMTPSKNLYMDTKDLTEIPDFIVFCHIEKYRLGLGIDSKCKVKEWTPRVQGYCAGIVVEGRPKVQVIDLSECEIRNVAAEGLLYVEQTGVKSIVGGHGDGVKIFIKKNKNLSELDLKGVKSCMNPGSYIVNNKNLELDLSRLPKGISIQNNKAKEKLYIS